MKWATTTDLGNQGPPAAWVISRFIDKEAKFLFFPEETALAQAGEEGALTFYVEGGDFYKDETRTTFEALMDKYSLRGKDPALDRMAEIFNDISFRVKQKLPLLHPQSPGVRALMLGFNETVPEGGAVRLGKLLELFDALYVWSAKQTKK